jgi:hypothetical protein
MSMLPLSAVELMSIVLETSGNWYAVAFLSFVSGD